MLVYKQLVLSRFLVSLKGTEICCSFCPTNLLTAMMNSLCSLKVISGSERHLENWKINQLNTSREPLLVIHFQILAAASSRPISWWIAVPSGLRDTFRRSMGICDGRGRGELTWDNSSGRWWWSCCPTSRDPGPCPPVPWLLCETRSGCEWRSWQRRHVFKKIK